MKPTGGATPILRRRPIIKTAQHREDPLCRPFAIPVFALPILLAGLPSLAQTRHAAAHVHGTAHMTVVVAQDQVSIEISIPAADIVSFERQPRDAPEQLAIDDAIQTLSDPLSLFSISPQVQCELAAGEVTFVGAVEEDDHEHEAEEEHSHGNEAHFEFAASYLIDCSSIASADLRLETRFFENFPGSDAIEIEGLIEGAAFRATMAPDTPSVDLRSPG